MILGRASERSVEASSLSVNAASHRSKAGFTWVYPDSAFGAVSNSTYHLVRS
jgi:hypothetical protein